MTTIDELELKGKTNLRQMESGLLAALDLAEERLDEIDRQQKAIGQLSEARRPKAIKALRQLEETTARQIARLKCNLQYYFAAHHELDAATERARAGQRGGMLAGLGQIVFAWRTSNAFNNLRALRGKIN